MEEHLNRTIPETEPETDEYIDENVDDMDSDIFRLKIAKELSDQLFIIDEVKNKQISRLTKKEITILTMMEMTDEILGFPLYEKFARNFRVQMISLDGGSRREVVDLVKSMGNTPENEFVGNEHGENRGFFSRIKHRLLG